MISKLPGVEQVLTREEAAKKFRSMPSRIGEIVAVGDRDTVFGDLNTESEDLPPEYRSHGGFVGSPCASGGIQCGGGTRGRFFPCYSL